MGGPPKESLVFRSFLLPGLEWLGEHDLDGSQVKGPKGPWICTDQRGNIAGGEGGGLCLKAGLFFGWVCFQNPKTPILDDVMGCQHNGHTLGPLYGTPKKQTF